MSKATTWAATSILAVFCVASLSLWGAVGFVLKGSHEDSMQQAISAGRNLARNIAEHEASSIQAVDLLVQYFRHEWIRNPTAFSSMVEHHRDFLAVSKVSQVAVIGADGRVAYSSIPGWKPVDLSDRQHFKVHQQRGTDEMYISAPVLGRVSGVWTIQFTRPILDQKGRFSGVMVLSIPPPALQRYYKDFSLGEGGAIALARFDGQILGHSGDLDKAVNITLTDTPGLHPEDPPEGQYQRRSMIDGVERIYRYHKVDAYPFAVLVGQNIAQVLAQYHKLKTICLFSGGAAMLLMLTVSLLMISKIRRSEESRKRQALYEAELRQGEEKFRLIAETIDAVVWFADISNKCFFYVSPAYERIWSRTFSGTQSERHPLAESIYEQDQERVCADLELKKGTPFEHEYRIVHPDGSVHWIWGRGFPVRNETGEISRYVGVAQDITARKFAQEKINRFNEKLEQRVEKRTADLQMANAELLYEKEQHQALIKKLEEAQNQLLQSEKMASIGQLAAGVAHEINNPVGFVSSNLGTMRRYSEDMLKLLAAYEQEESGLSHSVQENMKHLKHQIDFVYLKEDLGKLLEESEDGLQRVKQIVQDLKNFSRAGEAEWLWANLEAGLESTLNVVWNEIKYKAVVIREYGGIPDIECIPSQLNQVFMNLLINAAQAIKERGQIIIRTGHDDASVWVEITDTGSGIAPENLKRIFDPFFTTKPIGQGTGLGLSLSYSIVQKHGGRVDVSSILNEGTTFRVVLPLLK